MGLKLDEEYEVLYKGLVTHDKYIILDYLTIFSHEFLFYNQGKLLKKHNSIYTLNLREHQNGTKSGYQEQMH